MLVSVQSYFYTFLIRSLFLSEQFGNQCGMEGLNSVVREFKKLSFTTLKVDLTNVIKFRQCINCFNRKESLSSKKFEFILDKIFQIEKDVEFRGEKLRE